jgi:hypothetical protein
MTALPGGTEKNDNIEAHKRAVLLRGGLLPQASVSPAALRAALLAHVRHPNRQYTLPASGKKSADNATRDGVAERFAAPAVQKPLAVELALRTSYDELRRDLERAIVHSATQPEAQPLSLGQTVPGLGKRLSLGRRYDIYRIDRGPSVQALAAYCRVVNCRQASGGNHLGTSGKKSGHPPLKGAFAEAAALGLRNNDAGQKSLAR